MNTAAVIWLALLVVFLFIEANTVALVSSWFAGGALVAMIAALFGAPIWVQFLLFLGTSGILLMLLRPFLRKYITPKLHKTNMDAVIGSRGVVTKVINNDIAEGQIKLGGMEWTARSTNGEILSPGTQVVVNRIEGVKVFVSPVKAREPML